MALDLAEQILTSYPTACLGRLGLHWVDGQDPGWEALYPPGIAAINAGRWLRVLVDTEQAEDFQE